MNSSITINASEVDEIIREALIARGVLPRDHGALDFNRYVEGYSDAIMISWETPIKKTKLSRSIMDRFKLDTEKEITESDRDFIRWIYDRFAHQYDEDPNLDWMQRLKSIALNQSKDAG